MVAKQSEVHRTSFWMMHYGADSAKRTVVYSNSPSLIRWLDPWPIAFNKHRSYDQLMLGQRKAIQE